MCPKNTSILYRLGLLNTNKTKVTKHKILTDCIYIIVATIIVSFSTYGIISFLEATF